ncbi:MAG: DUF4276 family protein [Gemmatimonadota bacterium]|nr:DUF4276 family protein [Gemmatimonadota bacterium]
MSRLLVHVEGETEETFVNEVLSPYLYNRGYSAVSARLMGNTRQRSRRGGIKGWDEVRKDILGHLKQDAGRLVTTMVDYYGLPQSGNKTWPGRKTAGGIVFEQKAKTVEDALSADISQEMGGAFNSGRFIPYVMMHEFEAMLFSDCEGFGRVIGRVDLVEPLQAIRDQFANPEEIDDSPRTAPSKRIEHLMPNYQKPLMGNLAALEIGIHAIRRECPHFEEWLERLERSLATSG